MTTPKLELKSLQNTNTLPHTGLYLCRVGPVGSDEFQLGFVTGTELNNLLDVHGYGNVYDLIGLHFSGSTYQSWTQSFMYLVARTARHHISERTYASGILNSAIEYLAKGELPQIHSVNARITVMTLSELIINGSLLAHFCDCVHNHNRDFVLTPQGTEQRDDSAVRRFTLRGPGPDLNFVVYPNTLGFVPGWRELEEAAAD